MGKKLLPVLCFLLFHCLPDIHAQEITLGAYSGINLSDIHGNLEPGHWEFNPGPAIGINADAKFLGVIGITTGIRLSSVYYEFTPYYTDSYPLYDEPLCRNCLMPPYYYYPVRNSMNFSSFTVPVEVRITIPSKPELSISAGMFYSRAYDNSLTYINTDKPEQNDYGFKYSAGLSWPVTEKLKFSFNLSYLTGRKEFIDFQTYRHGAVDFTVGLGYTLFEPGKPGEKEADTSSVKNRITVIYTGGINISKNRVKSYAEKYGTNYGPSLGFLVDFSLGRGASFRTGLMFERTGYSMKDSSDLFYRYAVNGNPDFFVDSRVSIDYISMPALLNIFIGKSRRASIFTGPYAGFFLNARCTGEAFIETSNQSFYNLTSYNINDDIERIMKGTDFGWIVGGSMSIPLYRHLSLDLGVQYRAGFGEVFNRENNGEPEMPGFGGLIIRNGSLSVQAGIRVPVQRKN